MSASSSAATYIGRIGGLAVALGVGAAIASGTGVAWADSTDSSASSASSSSSSGSDSSADRKKDRPSDKGTSSKDTSDDSAADTGDAADKPDESDEDQAKDDDDKASTDEGSEDKPAAKRPKRSSAERPATTEDTSDSSDSGASDDSEDSEPAAVAEPTTIDTEPAGTADSAPVTTQAVVPTATTAAPAEVAPKRQRLVTRLFDALGLPASATDAPTTPAQSPGLLAMLGWVRRDAERELTAASPTTTTAATPTAAAVVDPLPNSLPSKRIGWVTGPGITTPGGFQIYGTDLGIMWDGGLIDGQRFVHVAFGDTFSGPNMQGGWRSNALLISFDDDLRNGLGLAPTGYAGQFIPGGQALGLFGSEVTVIPTSGIRVLDRQYVNYMSVKSWDTPGRWTTNFSAISRYNPVNDKWETVGSTIRSAGWLRSSTPYRPGDQNFQQMAYVLQPEDQVAEGDPRYLYAMGTPSGRAGSAYLSRVAEGSVTDLSKYEYWDGGKWVVGNAAVAKPIIGDSDRSGGLFGFITDWANDPNVFGGYLGGLFGAKTGGNVSEMSVQYNEYLDKYVVLYGDGNNNIQMRVADTPEGAWSDPVQLASSAQYPGLYAPMIHPWSGTGALQGAGGGSDYNNLYWNMSIWGNYNVVLMSTDLSPLLPVEA
jgi:Domain of unknown function (DUF4185)